MTSSSLDHLEDAELLRKYARGQSEEAFTILVGRYVDLIYSAALRRVRDPHLAEDVTQAVFLILARRACNISSRTVLASWLYKTARYVSANALRMQRRCTLHEQAAAALPRKEPRMDSNWEQIEVVLEDAMDSLHASDRELILQRFFRNQSLADISARLGVSDNTAAKRVSRAVERLRAALTHRGVTAAGAGLLALLSERTVRAAPAAAANVSINSIASSSTNGIASEVARQVVRFMGLQKAALVSLATVLALTLPVTIVLIAHAQPNTPASSAPAFPPPATTQPLALAASLAALDRKLPELRLENVALSDTMEFLRDTTGVHFNVDWKSLASVGVPPTALITLRQQDMTLKQVLVLIFSQFPNANGRIKIEVGNDGAVNISAIAN